MWNEFLAILGLKMAPFRRGDLVSNGEIRRVVNYVFIKNGECFMLVDTFKWHNVGRAAEYCEEVRCSDWYKIA